MPASTERHETDLAGRPWRESPLRAVVDAAYAAFDYPPPPQTCVCDCCPDRRLMRELLTLEPRLLTVRHFESWFVGSADQPIDKALWGRLLPRVLELMSVGEALSGIGIEVQLSRFPTGDAAAWSPDEWRALDAWRHAFLDAAPLRTVGCDNLDDVLCMFASAGWPADALFEHVLAWPDGVLVDVLWRDWADCRHPSIWITAFWDDDEVPMAFYTADSLYERLTGIVLGDAALEERQTRASQLVDLIEMFRGPGRAGRAQPAP